MSVHPWNDSHIWNDFHASSGLEFEQLSNCLSPSPKLLQGYHFSLQIVPGCAYYNLTHFVSSGHIWLFINSPHTDTSHRHVINIISVLCLFVLFVFISLTECTCMFMSWQINIVFVLEHEVFDRLVDRTNLIVLWSPVFMLSLMPSTCSLW